MEKLLSLIERLEKKLSQIILLLMAFFMMIVTKFFRLWEPLLKSFVTFFVSFFQSMISGFKNFFQVLNSMVGPRAWNYYRHKIQHFIEKVQEERAEKIKLLAKQKDAADESEDTPKNEPPIKKKSFISDLGLLIDVFLNRLSKVSPLKFALMGMLFLILLLNIFHFLKNSNDLANSIQEDENVRIRREIASTLDKIPDYYNDVARTSSIKSLKIPAYASSIHKIKHLELDTQILFYNRSGKQFFDDFQIVFLDHLEMSIEPIHPTFPLSPEGKMVIKQKIMYEIDTVFKEMGVNSHVENVFFTNIFAN